MTCITADSQSLVGQAIQTVGDYFDAARRHIDLEWGKGYAKAHPEMVAAYMQVAASDYNTAITAKVLGEAIESVAHSMDHLNIELDIPNNQIIADSITDLANSLGEHKIELSIADSEDTLLSLLATLKQLIPPPHDNK